LQELSVSPIDPLPGNTRLWAITQRFNGEPPAVQDGKDEHSRETPVQVFQDCFLAGDGHPALENFLLGRP
jgi:hypothetical protein